MRLLGLSRKGSKRPDLALMNKDPRIIAKKIRSSNKSPNGIESRVISIINSYKIPLKYKGKSSTFNGMKPDFVSTNGKKKVVEIFGRRFHDPRYNKTIRILQTVKGRTKALNELGYQVKILWDSDIYKLTDELIADELKRFMK